MNYLKPDLLDALAAEYVLGTLHGQARLRFERLQTESYRVRQVVWEWEQRINPLASACAEVTPPGRVWQGIRQRTFGRAGGSSQTGVGLGFWRWLTGASMALVLVMAVFIGIQYPFTQSQWDQVATFSDEDNKPLWLVTTDSTNGRLLVRAINAQALAVDDRAYELWMLPQSGQPRSLGVMPVSQSAQETTLSPQILALLQDSAGLAISVEPPGGSPTGQPTGPVVYQAPILAF